MRQQKQGDNSKDFAELSARLVHDVTTPVAIIKVNNELIARHLPALLSAYEAQHPKADVIPSEHLQAMRESPGLVMEQCARVEQLLKAHWNAAQRPPSAREKSPEPVKNTPDSRSGGLDILLVEDEAVHQDIALSLLTPSHRVDVASSGREAISKCEEKPYDLVLMDICLPDIDGRQATRLIRRTHRRGLTILTLSNMPISEDELRDAGFDGQLAKPLSPDALRQYLPKVLLAPHAGSSI